MTRALVAGLQALIVQIDVLTDQITEQLHAHADAHIFRSLPRAQALRAGRLLAEIGDARGRFPHPRGARLAGWGRPFDPAVGQEPDRRVPLGRLTGSYATPSWNGPATRG